MSPRLPAFPDECEFADSASRLRRVAAAFGAEGGHGLWVSFRRGSGGLLAAVLALVLAEPCRGEESIDQLMELSLEELMDMPVYSASKFSQKKSDAPAAVTVLTDEDIRDFGYRTLADALRSVRGLFVDYDRSYNYLGTNGFRRPGEFNGRFLLLIDGYRVNEVIYDQASIGTDFLLDPETIERIEYVPGAGSSVYGSNAFFGVVNVITKSGRGLNGVEVSGQVASFGTDRERLSAGRRFDNGLEALVSASHYASNGQNLRFAEFRKSGISDGVARGMDEDRADRLFGKLSYGNFTAEMGFSNRKKFVPTGAYGTSFNRRPNYVLDQQFFADLSYSGDLGERLNLYAHVFHGRYDYFSDYPYFDGPGPNVINRDESFARWAGAEFKLMSTHFAGHKLILGGEYQNSYRQDQLNFDIASPPAYYLNDRRSSYRFGFYAQDEFSLFENLVFNIGLRADHYSTFGTTFNPRIAAIYKPQEQTALKFLYGTAFRAPNAYELYYASPQFQPNPNLQPDKVRSYEVIVEHQATPQLRLTVTGRRTLMDGLVTQAVDPANGLLHFTNLENLRGWGADLEVEHRWESGARLRASYSWTRLRDSQSSAALINSPEHLAKLNLVVPVWEDRLRLGLDAQYVGSRRTRTGQNAAGFPVFNLTLTSSETFAKSFLKGVELSASLYNLFDKSYANVAGDEHVMPVIQQDGRSFRVMATLRF